MGLSNKEIDKIIENVKCERDNKLKKAKEIKCTKSFEDTATIIINTLKEQPVLVNLNEITDEYNRGLYVGFLSGLSIVYSGTLDKIGKSEFLLDLDEDIRKYQSN